jgi:hypothetical protein
MAISLQWDLFEPIPNETDILRKEIQALKESQDRQRKNLFAKHAELMKIVMQQQAQIDKLNEMMMKRIK